MLATSAVCGVDATGTLDVTSTEGGTQAVPVNIPTGRPGPPTTHTKTETLPIPDDNAGGVASNLFVPVSGRIKDLDVRIDSIDHSFVGDLKVELTSPDNSTTVRLIEHVGGPNNGGDDLVDTRVRRRGAHGDRVGRQRGSVHRQLPPAGRPALALRRQGAAGHLEAARERPLRERHRLAARLEHDHPHRPVRPERERARDADPGGAAVARGIAPRELPVRLAAAERSVPVPPRRRRLHAVLVARRSSANLPEGDHTFEVRAYDQYGNVDGSPAIYTWTVDVTAPGPRIAAAGGSTPVVQGTRRHVRRRRREREGGPVLGRRGRAARPSQSMVVARDGSGSFSAQFDPVPAGTYTVAARQSDAAGNSGSSAPVSFTVGGAAVSPPRLRGHGHGRVDRGRRGRPPDDAQLVRGRVLANHVADGLLACRLEARPAAAGQPRRCASAAARERRARAP